jgi:hypothetical protein
MNTARKPVSAASAQPPAKMMIRRRRRTGSRLQLYTNRLRQSWRAGRSNRSRPPQARPDDGRGGRQAES